MSTLVRVDCFVGYFDAMSSVGNKDYYFNWAPFMQTGDVIDPGSISVTADPGVIVGNGTIGGPAPVTLGNIVLCWLSFEPTAMASEYRVYCYIETTDGRKERRYAILRKCA